LLLEVLANDGVWEFGAGITVHAFRTAWRGYVRYMNSMTFL
jgi:hypothetical protein